MDLQTPRAPFEGAGCEVGWHVSFFFSRINRCSDNRHMFWLPIVDKLIDRWKIVFALVHFSLPMTGECVGGGWPPLYELSDSLQIPDVSTDAARAPRGLWRGGVTRPNGSFVSRARRVRIAISPTDGGRTRRSSIRAHCRSFPRLGRGQGMYLAYPSPATWAVTRAVTPGQMCFCAAKVLALCLAV